MTETIPPPVALFLPFFAAAFFGLVVLYSLEVKIMKKLEVIDADQWKRLIGWLGRPRSRRFREFLCSPIEDEEIQEWANSYRRVQRFVFQAMAVCWVIVLGTVLFIVIINS